MNSYILLHLCITSSLFLPWARLNSIRILNYDKNVDNVFAFGRHPDTNQNVQPSQFYLLFDDVVFPDGTIQNYPDEVNKLPALPKHLSNDEKVWLLSF